MASRAAPVNMVASASVTSAVATVDAADAFWAAARSAMSAVIADSSNNPTSGTCPTA